MPQYHVYSAFSAPDFQTDLYVTEVEAESKTAAIQAVVDQSAAEDNSLTLEAATKYSYRAYLASDATEKSPSLVV